MAKKVCDTGEPLETDSPACRKFHFNVMKKRDEDAKRLGTPLIMTEFGACSNTQACYLEISNAADAFDSTLSSWAYWQFKGFGDFTTTGGLTEGMWGKDGKF